jgi:hypothetical protein
MTEPNNDTSITPLAAIRCGNTECENFDRMFFKGCRVHGSTGVAACEGYRPADHIPDATKMVKCYNADCDYYDTRYTDQCCAESTSPVCICPGYRTAERGDEDGETIKTALVDAEYTEILASARTERDQARAELAAVREVLRKVEWGSFVGMKDDRCPCCLQYKAEGRHTPTCTLAAALTGHAEHPAVVELANLKRALELTGTVLPDIDEAQYEYSAVGEEKPGKWPELWVENWEPRERQRRCDMSGALLRRRRRVRRAPTDADAIEQPRRDCWVRNNADEDWIPATLLAVDETRFPKGPKFLVMREDGRTVRFNSCEIEVEA